VVNIEWYFCRKPKKWHFVIYLVKLLQGTTCRISCHCGSTVCMNRTWLLFNVRFHFFAGMYRLCSSEWLSGLAICQFPVTFQSCNSRPIRFWTIANNGRPLFFRFHFRSLTQDRAKMLFRRRLTGSKCLLHIFQSDPNKEIYICLPFPGLMF
jgi:hypothetical protein